jgi:hypothetical protein
MPRIPLLAHQVGVSYRCDRTGSLQAEGDRMVRVRMRLAARIDGFDKDEGEILSVRLKLRPVGGGTNRGGSPAVRY